MHEAMKQLLPGAMFIGFTGTPLLKADKATSIETFGSFIHTYKFDEAVRTAWCSICATRRATSTSADLAGQGRQVVRAQDQGHDRPAKAELKKRWGTMQKIVSRARVAKQIVDDILLDMETKPRLMDGRGNAMLVGSSIYQACKFYELFCQAGFKGKCAIVTSYEPQAGDISKEDSGEGATEKLRQYDIYRQMLADHFNEPADTAMTKVEQFEKEVKERFINEPGQMRLLIVVDKLLTGFDAPQATYLYIDKKMRDHGLFQAICRVNRLDGDDKDYGYIVDYQDLFNSLRAPSPTTPRARSTATSGRTSKACCPTASRRPARTSTRRWSGSGPSAEPVAPPKNTLQYQHYFCARSRQRRAAQGQRAEAGRPLQGVAAVTRAYGNLANEMVRPATATPKRKRSRTRSPTTPTSATRSSSAPARTSTSSSTRPGCASC